MKFERANEIAQIEVKGTESYGMVKRTTTKINEISVKLQHNIQNAIEYENGESKQGKKKKNKKKISVRIKQKVLLQAIYNFLVEQQKTIFLHVSRITKK